MAPASVLVALGGHAIIRPGKAASVAEEVAGLRESLAGVAALIREGHRVVVTHGNGPQVGHELIRSEAARGLAYPLPLDVCVAHSQGEIGYLLQQELSNRLRGLGVEREVVALVCRTLVDGGPLEKAPLKPVGPVLSVEQAERLKAAGTRIVHDRKRGLRRAVPSPEPIRIVEGPAIRRLHEAGVVVVAAGGGGIPVREEPDGTLVGVEAVIDKDLASALLARDLGIEVLLDLTSVEMVRLNYGTMFERPVASLTVDEARLLLAEGQFPPGTMGPKVEAVIRFLEGGGRRAVVTDPAHAFEGVLGRAGTQFVMERKGEPCATS
jgi:carbamate kinase